MKILLLILAAVAALIIWAGLRVSSWWNPPSNR